MLETIEHQQLLLETEVAHTQKHARHDNTKRRHEMTHAAKRQTMWASLHHARRDSNDVTTEKSKQRTTSATTTTTTTTTT